MVLTQVVTNSVLSLTNTFNHLLLISSYPTKRDKEGEQVKHSIMETRERKVNRKREEEEGREGQTKQTRQVSGLMS